MIGGLATRGYRGVMRAAAAAGAVAAALPGAPAAWRGLADRLGRLPPDARAALTRAPVQWLHAASVGELRAARPLLAGLRARRPGRVVLATTLTRTGLALARELPEVDVACLLPIDAGGPLAALLDGVRLEVFCFTETEVWPGLLGELARRRVPAVMVSGRVGPRTASRARWLRPVYGPALARVVCCMQSAGDAAGIVALGARPEHVHVTGSLKFEAEAGDPPESVRRLAAQVGTRPLFVAGSTHEGEEAAILAAYTRLVARHPELLLLLAPRHPQRLDAVRRLVADRGMPLVSFRALAAGDATVPARSGVILLDVMGPLAHCYGLAVAGFVGGSLVPAGGHNVLEPARAGCPVLVGPHTANAREAVARILESGGGRRVRDPAGIADALAGILADPGSGRAMGLRARRAIADGEGALARHLAVLDVHLRPGAPACAAGAG